MKSHQRYRAAVTTGNGTCALLGPALGLEGARNPKSACVCTACLLAAGARRCFCARGARIEIDCTEDIMAVGAGRWASAPVVCVGSGGVLPPPRSLACDLSNKPEQRIKGSVRPGRGNGIDG